jgi:S1-C subfamily serine protease
VLVLSVTADSPAEEGGLRANDIILTFDGKKVNEEATLLDLLTAKKPGDTVTLGILRGGQELSVNVTLGKRSDVRQSEGQRTLEDLLRELQRRFSGR